MKDTELTTNRPSGSLRRLVRWRDRRVKIRPIFAWYDLWIGAFWDRKAYKLYLLPLPCVGLIIEFQEPPNNSISTKREVILESTPKD